MERIIHGIRFEGKTLPDTWQVRLWETANGHREISARRAIEWREVGTAPSDLGMSVDQKRASAQAVWVDYIDAAETEQEREVRIAERDADAADREEKNRKRSAKRAKTMCRRKIKACNMNEVLTITYRENQDDLALFKKHFKEWVRRMRKALGGEFLYVSGFEPQKRGAWHAHVTCHKLPRHVEHKGVLIRSWQLGTAIWRSIVGADNGMVFVGGKDRFGRPRRDLTSTAKMAAYVSKYITKYAELFPSEKNRYSCSNGIEIDKPYTMTVAGLPTAAQVLDLAFQCGPGEVIVNHRFDVEGDDWERDSYWLVTEPDMHRDGSNRALSALV